ncbi:Calcineurin-like_phosphoesterase [Hexamita inflata]|uniref:Calcineurin-like phosphoesterase n=1 Tax=Hexamita inflata TaxID=28002 RepID=A0AA86NY56_9EUKA|nr:Calcineurin-like phosphoesterase [Hexamita inflata]
MQITHISDIHGLQRKILSLPGGDILFVTGDVTSSTRPELEVVLEFFEFLQRQNYDFIVLIAGNHDKLFQEKSAEIRSLLKRYPKIFYLEDEMLCITVRDQPLRIFGTPHSALSWSSAFVLTKQQDIINRFQKSVNADIVLSHGPPFGILDLTQKNENIGCGHLLNFIIKEKPKLHLFGHVHEAFGSESRWGTHFVNGAVLNERIQMREKLHHFTWNYAENQITFQ